jgi:hypothetical protein
MAADEQKYFLGVNPNIYFKTSEVSTSVGFANSTLSFAGGMKVKHNRTSDGSTTTVIVPFMTVATS